MEEVENSFLCTASCWKYLENILIPVSLNRLHFCSMQSRTLWRENYFRDEMHALLNCRASCEVKVLTAVNKVDIKFSKFWRIWGMGSVLNRDWTSYMILKPVRSNVGWKNRDSWPPIVPVWSWIRSRMAYSVDVGDLPFFVKRRGIAECVRTFAPTNPISFYLPFLHADEPCFSLCSAPSDDSTSHRQCQYRLGVVGVGRLKGGCTREGGWMREAARQSREENKDGHIYIYICQEKGTRE